MQVYLESLLPIMYVFFQLVPVIKVNSPAETGPAYKIHGDVTVKMTVVTNLMKKDVLDHLEQHFLNPLKSIPVVNYLHSLIRSLDWK